jgi:hypothetical protein
VIVVEKITGNKLELVFAFGEMRPYYRNNNVAWKRSAELLTQQPARSRFLLAIHCSRTPGSMRQFGLWKMAHMSILRKKVHSGAGDYTGVLKKQL